jgi:hypothetical protein
LPRPLSRAAAAVTTITRPTSYVYTKFSMQPGTHMLLNNLNIVDPEIL